MRDLSFLLALLSVAVSPLALYYIQQDRDTFSITIPCPPSTERSPFVELPQDFDPLVAAHEAPAEFICGNSNLGPYEAFERLTGGREVFQRYFAYPSGTPVRALNGEVAVDFYMNSKGQVGRFHIAKSLNPDYDHAVVEAVSRTGFLKPSLWGPSNSVKHRLSVVFKDGLLLLDSVVMFNAPSLE